MIKSQSLLSSLIWKSLEDSFTDIANFKFLSKINHKKIKNSKLESLAFWLTYTIGRKVVVLTLGK